MGVEIRGHTGLEKRVPIESRVIANQRACITDRVNVIRRTARHTRCARAFISKRRNEIFGPCAINRQTSSGGESSQLRVTNIEDRENFRAISDRETATRTVCLRDRRTRR